MIHTEYKVVCKICTTWHVFSIYVQVGCRRINYEMAALSIHQSRPLLKARNCPAIWCRFLLEACQYISGVGPSYSVKTIVGIKGLKSLNSDQRAVLICLSWQHMANMSLSISTISKTRSMCLGTSGYLRVLVFEWWWRERILRMTSDWSGCWRQ
jgi:hypothetical protein